MSPHQSIIKKLENQQSVYSQEVIALIDKLQQRKDQIVQLQTEIDWLKQTQAGVVAGDVWNQNAITEVTTDPEAEKKTKKKNG